MAITLDHTIVPARDKEAAAKWFARIFGLEYSGPAGHFAPVRVNQSLTLDFDEGENFDIHHYAFRVEDEDFDAIFSRVRQEGIPFGSGPFSRTDGEVSRRRSGPPGPWPHGPLSPFGSRFHCPVRRFVRRASGTGPRHHRRIGVRQNQHWPRTSGRAASQQLC
jgi:catechol 2,3-dioxygenase-like lactoylglutathione lyase family enzyme